MAERDRDEASGKFTEEYPREAFIRAIRDASGMASTSDVAGSVGCIRETAYKKLKQMESDGEVNGRKFGNSLVWEIGDE